MPEIKKLQTITGVTITAPSDLSSTSSTIRIAEYASDAAYVSANGAAAAGSVYVSSATGVKTLRYYTGSSWRNLVPANDPADPTKIFYVDITGNTTGKFAKILFACTDDRTYTFQDETGTVPVLPILLGSEVSGQLPIANGGTGQATAQTARNALLPTQSGNSGKFLKTDGTDVSWDTAGGGGSVSSPEDATNYGFTTSVGASALTINLKNAAGSDATVGDPITISMRNATLATGTYSSRSVTSALSIVVSSGATLGHADGKASPIFVYALDNSGTVELAVSTTRFDDSFIGSTTVMSSSSDVATTIYSTTARSNVPMRLIGRMISTQTTAGTWAATPTQIDLNPLAKMSSSEVCVYNGANGHGSTNICIRRFSATFINRGTAITYADSATLGATFTINEDGIYSINYQDARTSGSAAIGISLNSTELTTSISSISFTNFVAYVETGSSAESGQANQTMFLKAGDVIRAHTDGLPGILGDNKTRFRIVQLVKF
jgi:hypothetical protein